MEAPKKECPDCGIIMAYDKDSKSYTCLDPECGYAETEEPEEEEEDESYHCPHCGKEIDEDDLPN